jgi:hypothetical protein
LKLKRILLRCSGVDAGQEKHSRIICGGLVDELTLEDKRV